MRILNIVLATALATSPAAFGSPAMAKSPFERAVQLDKLSKAMLGVSIRALGLLLLVYDSHEHYFRKDSVVRDGSWPELQSLQKNGYAKLSIVTGMHDERDQSAEFVLVKLTDKGRGVAASFVPWQIGEKPLPRSL